MYKLLLIILTRPINRKIHFVTAKTTENGFWKNTTN